MKSAEPGETSNAWFELFAAHSKKDWNALHRFACQLGASNDDAKDILQTALVRGMKAFQGFAERSMGACTPTQATQLLARDSTEPLRRWLYKIVKNVYLDHHASAKNWVLMDAVELDETSNAASRYHESGTGSDAAMSDFVAAQLKALPEWQRALLYLFSEGYTYEDMACILDIPIGTVMTGMFRAREKFRVTERGRKS